MKPDNAYLGQAITNLAAGITFEISGDTYAGVVRHAGPALPTEADVMAEIARIKAAEPLVESAAAALAASDRVATRCVKAGVPYPQAWQDYDSALRNVVRGLTEQMPARPPFPAGT